MQDIVKLEISHADPSFYENCYKIFECKTFSESIFLGLNLTSIRTSQYIQIEEVTLPPVNTFSSSVQFFICISRILTRCDTSSYISQNTQLTYHRTPHNKIIFSLRWICEEKVKISYQKPKTNSHYFHYIVTKSTIHLSAYRDAFGKASLSRTVAISVGLCVRDKTVQLYETMLTAVISYLLMFVRVIFAKTAQLLNVFLKLCACLNWSRP